MILIYREPEDAPFLNNLQKQMEFMKGYYVIEANNQSPDGSIKRSMQG